MKNLLLIGVLFLLFNKAHSFTLNTSIEAAFDPKNPITVNVNSQSCQNLGISNERLLELIGPAVDNFWNTIPSSSLRLLKGTLITPSNASNLYSGSVCSSGPDGTCTVNNNMTVESGILITCNNNGQNFNNSALVFGTAVPVVTSGDKIISSLVLLNDGANSAFGSLSENEQVAVLAHEIGHAIGLGHSPVSDSLMYYSTVRIRDYLGQDDIDGLTYLYPAKEAPLSAGSCASVALIGTGKSDSYDDFQGPKPLHFFGQVLVGLLIAIAFTRKRPQPKLK